MGIPMCDYLKAQIVSPVVVYDHLSSALRFLKVNGILHCDINLSTVEWDLHTKTAYLCNFSCSRAIGRKGKRVDGDFYLGEGNVTILEDSEGDVVKLEQPRNLPQFRTPEMNYYLVMSREQDFFYEFSHADDIFAAAVCTFYVSLGHVREENWSNLATLESVRKKSAREVVDDFATLCSRLPTFDKNFLEGAFLKPALNTPRCILSLFMSISLPDRHPLYSGYFNLMETLFGESFCDNLLDDLCMRREWIRCPKPFFIQKKTKTLNDNKNAWKHFWSLTVCDGLHVMHLGYVWVFSCQLNFEIDRWIISDLQQSTKNDGILFEGYTAFIALNRSKNLDWSLYPSLCVLFEK